MPLRVLVVPDKFKGSLTAAQAADAMARGWRRARPQDSLHLLPMSDGGDGFGEILSQLLRAEPRECSTIDAAHRPLGATWWYHHPTQVAIIESAKVIGLAQLPAGKYHPFELDTRGLAPLLIAAIAAGARTVIVGIGGSATNDAGFGLATGLGWQFFNKSEKLDRWTKLHGLTEIRPPESPLALDHLVVAVDVQNPLLGPNGCTPIYGPQKGLLAQDFGFAERCLGRLADLLRQELHIEGADKPGAGAAGGLGFGLNVFAGAHFKPGFDLFAEHAALHEHLSQAQLVLTGEGSIDHSTAMGKGTGQIAQLCQRHHVPCIGLAGVAPNPALLRSLFTHVGALAPALTSIESAMAEPARWLERLTEQTARERADIADPPRTS